MSISLTKNSKSQYQTKHIDIQYFYIRKLIIEKKLNIKQICSLNMLVDKMTKVLSIETFYKYQILLG